jgi:hypothetical protein
VCFLGLKTCRHDAIAHEWRIKKNDASIYQGESFCHQEKCIQIPFVQNELLEARSHCCLRKNIFTVKYQIIIETKIVP